MARRYRKRCQPLRAERPKMTCVMWFSRTNSAAASATVLPFDLRNPPAEILREANILCQRPLVFRAKLAPGVDVAHIKLAFHALGHTRTAGNQILCRWIGTDAHQNTLAHRRRLGNVFLLQKCVETAIDYLGHLPQCQFAQRNQVARAERNALMLVRPARPDRYRRASCASAEPAALHRRARFHPPAA